MKKHTPTAAQLRNLEEGIDGPFFPGQGQSRSCDIAENKGWLKGEMALHTLVIVHSGVERTFRRAFRRAYTITSAGQKILKEFS